MEHRNLIISSERIGKKHERKNSQYFFNLKIIQEGLLGLSAPKEDQLKLNKTGMNYLDDIFDTMILDYVQYLEREKIILPETCKKIIDLYIDIENSVGSLNDKEIDGFIKNDQGNLNVWREKAVELIKEINNALETLEEK